VHSGASGVQNVVVLFLMLMWDRYRFHKKRIGTRYVELVFSSGRICESGARNVGALFFLLGWDRYRFWKKCVKTHYAKLVFLRLVGYAGHVVHSGASGVRNINTLFFMPVWDRYRY
jgi:hypothetical protein